jgi:hypothetical protein
LKSGISKIVQMVTMHSNMFALPGQQLANKPNWISIAGRYAAIGYGLMRGVRWALHSVTKKDKQESVIRETGERPI